MHPMMHAKVSKMVYMFITFCEKEKQYRGYRNSDYGNVL
jgi:hypothetical protein